MKMDSERSDSLNNPQNREKVNERYIENFCLLFVKSQGHFQNKRFLFFRVKFRYLKTHKSRDQVLLNNYGLFCDLYLQYRHE